MSAKARTFARHYVEMVVAMLLGMFVLGGALVGALALAGVDVASWSSDAPALELFGMGLTMTVPMVAWMRHRGHGWAPCGEMAASMFLPTFAAVALLAIGAIGDADTALAIQHLAMFPSMLGAMLLRPGEYTSHAVIRA